MLTVSFPHVGITVEREDLPFDVMSGSYEPDQEWRHVDRAGHGHFWKGSKTPTLERVVTGTTWVGDEYDGEEFEVAELRCRLCGEVVEPKRRWVPAKPIPGPTTVTLELDGKIYEHLSLEEYAASVREWARAVERITGRGPRPADIVFGKTG